MNRLPLLIALLLMGVLVVPLPGRAETKTAKPDKKAEEETKRLAERLHQLDKLGAFQPAFKKVAHEYVDVMEKIVQTDNEELKLRDMIPALQEQGVAALKVSAVLDKDLADCNHTDETDFVLLEQTMNDAAAKPKDRLLQAQVFLWSYPASSHLPQAQTYLQQMQKLIADQLQAEKDAAAAAAAARAKLLQRVHDRDLSLDEWKDFLTGLTQMEVTEYLGKPSQVEGGYWLYTDPWVPDPELNKKTGLRLNFNGGRVILVLSTPSVEKATPGGVGTPGSGD